jgi:hypothetical protein
MSKVETLEDLLDHPALAPFIPIFIDQLYDDIPMVGCAPRAGRPP